MAITENSGSASVDTTEYSFAYSANYAAASAKTTDGVLQSYVDVSGMLAGDEYQFKVYEMVSNGSGGSQRTVYQANISGTQTEAFTFPSLIVMHNWDVTGKLIAGTARTLWFSTRLIPVT